MTDFTIKKHGGSHLIEWSWRVYPTISASEIKNIVYDVTKKQSLTCMDPAGQTFLVDKDDYFHNNFRECRGIFVYSEQHANDIMYLINKTRTWNILKN